MRKKIIEIGDKYGRLTAISFDHLNIRKDSYWKFRCDCGKEKVISVSHVKRLKTISCGCYLLERITKHGMCESPIYTIWAAMKQRCLNKNYTQYKDYGGRGITICDEWLVFENFYKDMGDRPKNLTLDRIDNNKGYYKENCKWATRKEQSNNTRKNRFLTYKGKTQNISKWAKELRIKENTIAVRMCRGWSVERALCQV